MKTNKRRKSRRSLGDVSNDKLGILGAIGSFLFPPIGLIIWGVNKDESPKKAKSALMVAGISFGLSVALGITNYVMTKDALKTQKELEQ
jgi:hypothetical protein